MISLIIFDEKMKFWLIVLFISSCNLYSQNYLDYYFKANSIDGAIVIYNENKDEWIFSTESEPFLNTPIASHFHLWQALTGLQEKVFSINSNEKLQWDGVKRSFFEKRKPEWNKDMNLAEALQFQNDWYFDQLKYRLPDNLYTNNVRNSSILKDVKDNEIDFFWNFTGYTNPNTMILFLKDLYEGKLPFEKKNQQYLMQQLKIDSNLAIHTSTTSYLGQKIDWTVGVYFKQSKPIYFSLRTTKSLESPMLNDYDKRRNLVLTQIFEVLNY